MDVKILRCFVRDIVLMAAIVISSVAVKRFTASSMSSSKFMSSYSLKKVYDISEQLASFPTHGSLLCNAVEWCECFCKVSEDTIAIAKAILSPRMKDNATDVSPCWTTAPVGEMIGELGTFSVVSSSIATREDKTPSLLLLDGFYDYILSSCSKTMPDSSQPFICFDMGAARTISKIRLYAQPNDKAWKLFKNIEIKIGTTPKFGNFSDYVMFDFFEGAAVGSEFIYETNALTSMQGRYLAIETTHNGLQICHIEIY